MNKKSKDMKTGFFQSISGNNSSSRLIGFIVILNAMFISDFAVWYGLVKMKGDLVGICLAAGGLFVQMAGAAMFFMFQQKKSEVKQEKNENSNQ